ncbi:DUF5682 family protein [Rhodococcus cerastii]|nr:DUF5682 family protein [Rhodococcus cerastii]
MARATPGARTSDRTVSVAVVDAGRDVVVIGIRHHSPACARIVAETIERLQPTHVLIEGPADFTDRIDELRLDHKLPIALYSHVRRGAHTRVTWAAFTDWSPEWIALRSASKVSAEVRLIDLPAWHPAFDGPPDEYSVAATVLAVRLGLDTVDAMWDHVVESRADTLTVEELTAVLDDYFDAIRVGDATVSEREQYMASWIRAARERPGSGAVVVVCGGRHRPAIMSELARGRPTDGSWPAVPTAGPDVDIGSYLVPYSYSRLDLESPWWYEKLWQKTASAGEVAAAAIVRDLRSRNQRVSTTDFIGFRTQILGLAAIRGHALPTRRDVLDSAASTLVGEALASPLPWTLAGEPLGPEPDPVISACMRTMRGDRRGKLHRDSPVPGLVCHVDMLLEEFDLLPGPVVLDLADERSRQRSRALHQLRVLGVPGFERTAGPGSGSAVVSTERWMIVDSADRLPVLVEAAAKGHTLVEAAGANLESSLTSAAADVERLAHILFDAVLCGLDSVADRTESIASESLKGVGDLGGTGLLLRAALDLWRHDSLFGSRGSTLLGAIIDSASSQVVALAHRVRATTGGADLLRISALAALSDAMEYATEILSTDPADELTALARDNGAAVDIRGSALGTSWDRIPPDAAVDAVRSIPAEHLGDWLCGLFGVARERFLDAESSDTVLTAVDEIVSRLSEHEFLTALPALRQSFEFFPPRERDIIARRLTTSTPEAAVVNSLDVGRQLDARVDDALAQIGMR